MGKSFLDKEIPRYWPNEAGTGRGNVGIGRNTQMCEVKEVSGVRCSVSKRPVAGWAGWVRNNRSLFVSLTQS